MTADRKQKKAVRARAQADGVSYLAARRAQAGPGAGAPSAQTVVLEVAELLAARGWLVLIEQVPQFGQRHLYAGPLRIAVTDPGIDPDQDMLFDDDQPDDDAPSVAGPRSGAAAEEAAAGEVWLCAPWLDTGPQGFDRELPAGTSPAEIATVAAEGLAQARDAALSIGRAERGTATPCAICGEGFPAHHLLGPTTSEELLACPACVFDGDLTVYYEDPAWLTYQLDGLLDTDLAAPAGWAAVAALLAAGAGAGLPERLERAWRQAGTLFTPVERWGDPDANWIWLPRPARRPAWMAGLGPGARPSALLEALNTAVPGLQEQFVTALRDDYLDQIDDDDESEPVPDADTLALGWQAAVTYAVALSTDTADHPERRDPWHAMESFDSLGEHLTGLGGERDDLLLTAMIHAGVTVLQAHDAVITA